MKKTLLIIVVIILFLMFVPYRLALKTPEYERVIPSAPNDRKTASLYRLLELDGSEERLNSISIYMTGLASDRLAAKNGSDEPSRVTLWLDGVRPLGITSTYNGADEYFDIKGRSADQIDGYTYGQWYRLWLSEKSADFSDDR